MSKSISIHHDDSLYYECLAKIILQNKFKNWNLKVDDKPDLQDKDNGIGIEVTQILPTGCNQALSLMHHGKTIDGKLKKQGYDLAMEEMLFHPSKCYTQGKPFPTYNYLVEGIQKKVDKVLSYRKQFKEIDLYVFTDNLDIDLITLEELFLKIIEINNGSFDNIFVDACYEIFHLKKEYSSKYIIDKEVYTKYQYEAIKMEEDIKHEQIR